MKPLLVASLTAGALIIGAFFAGRFTAPTPPPVYIPIDPPKPQVVTITTHSERTRVVTRRVTETPDGGRVVDEREDERVVEGGAPILIPAPSLDPTPAPPPAYTAAARRAWKAGALVGLTFTPSSDKVVSVHYGLLLERRLFGPVWAGLQATTQPSVALTLSVEF